MSVMWIETVKVVNTETACKIHDDRRTFVKGVVISHCLGCTDRGLKRDGRFRESENRFANSRFCGFSNSAM